MISRNLFFFGIILAASGFLPPPAALAAGILYGMSLEHPFHADAHRLSTLLLQASVVALGFGMPLSEVVGAGRSGFLYTACSLAFALMLGAALGRLFRVRKGASWLITVGTAICGGSAIAAIAPIIQADDEDLAVSLGTVFLLNSVALIAFPLIGHAAGLGQKQFGLWAALAIHDTSSVVGAAARYGSVALAVGTTVKLARALWIVPVSLATAAIGRSRARIRWPWFIGLFCLAALANTCLPRFRGVFEDLNRLGRNGMTVTLFLIGAGVNARSLRAVGFRPLAQGLLLWIVIASVSLMAIRTEWLRP